MRWVAPVVVICESPRARRRGARKANALDQARDAYLALATDLPRTPSAASALFAAARMDERLARWDQAAASYERLSVTYPRDAHAGDACPLRMPIHLRSTLVASWRSGSTGRSTGCTPGRHSMADTGSARRGGFTRESAARSVSRLATSTAA
jgi:hypothetical protein